MTVEHLGAALGGHNIQVVVGAPDQHRYGLDADVAMWLPSGWWITLRNQFAQAPDVALKIIASVADELSVITDAMTHARGDHAETLSQELFAMTFNASGPDYWR